MGCEDCKIEPDGNDPTCQSCKGVEVKAKPKKEKVVVAPEPEPKRSHKKKQ
jgi:hypothetical protein